MQEYIPKGKEDFLQLPRVNIHSCMFTFTQYGGGEDGTTCCYKGLVDNSKPIGVHT